MFEHRHFEEKVRQIFENIDEHTIRLHTTNLGLSYSSCGTNLLTPAALRSSQKISEIMGEWQSHKSVKFPFSKYEAVLIEYIFTQE